MTYERFLKVILSLQKEDRTISKLYKNGVDLINFVEPYHNIITELIKEIYGEEGYEWFSWYCYESDFGQKDWSTAPLYKMKEDGTSELIHEEGEARFGAYDEEGNPICYSHESLWEYLNKSYEKEKVKKETKKT
jgi:hypothetical protein